MCGGNGWMWNGGPGGGWGWGGWLMTALVMVIFFVVLITAIVAAVRYLGGGHHVSHSTPTGRRPEDLLAERFARGEIDDEEYGRRVSLLREHR